MLRTWLRIASSCVILVFLFLSVSAQAETVVLVSGDTVYGEITKATDSSVFIHHDTFGQTEIPRNRIAAIGILHEIVGEIAVCPDRSVPSAVGKDAVEAVILAGGDTLHGRIAARTGSSVVFVHAVLGRLEIPEAQITGLTVIHGVLGRVTTCEDWSKSPDAITQHVNSPEGKKTAIQESKQEQEKAKAWFEPEFNRLNASAAKMKKKKWSANVDISLNSTSGNSDETSTRIGSQIKRELPRERTAIDVIYYYKETDGERTDNKFTTGAIHDWLNPGSRWFLFAAGRFDFDEFESWEERGNFQIGPGYSLIASEDVEIDLRFGAGGRREAGSENDDLKLEGLAGIDFTWRMTEKQNFDARFWYFPVLTDTADYRTRTTVNWRYRLAKDLNLSFIVGLAYEFQSLVDPGIEHSDTRTFVGIGAEF